MTLTHTGNAGDIIFSIPTINALAKRHGERATLYIKRLQYVCPYGDQYEFVKDLLAQQSGVKEVVPFVPSDNNWNYFKWSGLKPDYDLDEARHQKNRGRIHIIKRYFDQFDIREDHTKPFLKIDDYEKRNEKYALIHLTPRWNGLQYDWKRIYSEALERHGKVYFVGFQTEWLDFVVRFGQIEHLPTENLLQLSRLIRDCEALYCNQNVSLTIAQGLGKPYYLARNGYKTNCILGTPQEHIYGTEYLLRENTLNMPPDSHLKKGV